VDIPALVFFGGVAVAVIVAIIVSSQRRAAEGLVGIAKMQSGWERMRPGIAEQLELPGYRTPDDGGKRLTGFGGQVGRIIALQRPMRVLVWARTLPDADLRAVANLIDAHHAVQSRGMEFEPRLRTIVASRVRTTEERRIMTRAFRRSVLGWSPDAIARLLVDPKVSVKRRTAAEAAVAAGIALVDEQSELGELTERFVAALERADAAYLGARNLLRG
jgi:hypothetical protein